MVKTSYSAKISVLFYVLVFSVCLADNQTLCEKNILDEKKTSSDKVALRCYLDDDEEIFDIISFSDSEIFGSVTQSTSLKETGTELNDNFSKDKRSKFYREYIEKYYPRAYVIQEKFMKMKVGDLAAAINDIVYVFTKQPWFYFQNTPKDFRLIYFWEYVIDQLAILHDFLVNARLNKKTKEIFWSNNKSTYNYWSNFASSVEDDNSDAISDYLKENHIHAYSDFYALAFDYHVKMFNEGIFLNDMIKVNRYMGELEYILEKLKNTPREANYELHVKICKEVLAILRKKTGSTDYANFADYMDSSKNPTIDGAMI